MSNLGIEYIRTDIGSGKYFTKKISPANNTVYNFIKRAFDLLASLVAFIAACIPMLIIAVLIKMDSRGGAIFKQERLGKDGKVFTMYKFRTMCENAEKDGAKWADADDDRCTRVGKYLRKVRFDELPQLVNIIKGDMSIVGPRPERPCFYDEFETYIEGFCQRLAVKPGLTGLAQVSGGYELKPEEKIIFDLEYIEKRSILMDIKIIFKTVAVVLGCKGAR